MATTIYKAGLIMTVCSYILVEISLSEIKMLIIGGKNFFALKFRTGPNILFVPSICTDNSEHSKPCLNTSNVVPILPGTNKLQFHTLRIITQAQLTILTTHSIASLLSLSSSAIVPKSK